MLVCSVDGGGILRLLSAYKGLKQGDFGSFRKALACLLSAYKGLKHALPRSDDNPVFSLLSAYKGLKPIFPHLL